MRRLRRRLPIKEMLVRELLAGNLNGLAWSELKSWAKASPGGLAAIRQRLLKRKEIAYDPISRKYKLTNKGAIRKKRDEKLKDLYRKLAELESEKREILKQLKSVRG